MNAACRTFRLRLEEALRGHPSRGVPRELAWHEHLLGCAGCRDLLEAEEALEQVLATLPAPKLPPRLARRVLTRLRAAREEARGDGLDRLLDLDREPGLDAPPGLEERLLDGLAAARDEAALDRLLESVPAPRAPVGLAERVLAGVRAAEALELDRDGRLVPLPRPRRVVELAAAAVIVLGLGFAIWRGTRRAEEFTTTEPLAAFDAGESGSIPESDLELLQALDVLENWDLLNSTELDVLLADFDSLEAELLELEEPADEPEPVDGEEKRG